MRGWLVASHFVRDDECCGMNVADEILAHIVRTLSA